MTRRAPRQALLDQDVWDAPDRLTDDDLHAATGPDWRRRPVFQDRLEDEQ
jgi:hypothetical protein